MKKNALAKPGTYFAAFSLALVLSGQATPVQATTITFDYGTTYELTLKSYTEDGMTFSTDSHFHNGGWGFTNVIYFHSHAYPSFVEFSLGGVPFDLISMVVSDTSPWVPNAKLPTFTADNGSIVGAPWTLGTFVFPAGWTNITSVIWKVQGPEHIGTMVIDNIVFSPSTSLPAPSSLLLLGSGCAALCLWRGKFKRS